MPRKSTFLLQPSEWKIMKIVWELKTCVARDVYTRAGEEYGWAKTTSKTVLGKLVDKGYVSTKQVANCFVYRPARSAVKTFCQSIDALLEHKVEGTTGPLVAHILRKGDLSEDEVDMLREILDEYKSKKDKEK